MSHDWHMAVEDICDEQFLLDHHNRDGETLLRLDVSRSNTVEEIEEMLREAIGMLEDGVPEDVAPTDYLIREISVDVAHRVQHLQPQPSDSEDLYTVWVLLQWWEVVDAD